MPHTSLKAATLDRTPAAALCNRTKRDCVSVFRPWPAGKAADHALCPISGQLQFCSGPGLKLDTRQAVQHATAGPAGVDAQLLSISVCKVLVPGCFAMC